MPVDMSHRDQKTGQVTSDSKAARISDLELYGMMLHGTTNILKEFYTFRGGDMVSKADALHEIATKGSVSLADLDISIHNRTAVNTANVMLMGACIETDLVASGGILLRTIQQKDVKSMSREKTGLYKKEE